MPEPLDEQTQPSRGSAATSQNNETADNGLPENGEKNNGTGKRNKIIYWMTGAILLVLLVWFLLWLFYLRFHESTDDAYANGNLININSAVPGSCVAFYADDTDLVEKGQLLVLLDSTPYKITFEKELATLASEVLHVRELYTKVEVSRAEVESKRVAWKKAAYNYKNRKSLIGALAVSNEDYTHAKDDLKAARFALKQAESQLQVSLDAAGNTPIEKHPRIEKQKEIVRNAYYNLRHCSIFAPARGYVAKRAVEVGQWVLPNMNLMAVIPAAGMWVDANFKETELTHMRVGQPATVWFDIYGSDVEYKGKVLGISSGTGSVFSVIPPQNATGNWIKIVQRLAVRISLDPEMLEKYPARLGLSAEVKVNTSDRKLPMLSVATVKAAVGSTDVFDIAMDEVDQQIDQVIRKNLESHKPNTNGR